MWIIFNGLSLIPLRFLLFVLSCVILLIPSTVKSGFATFVPGAADMPKAANSPAASFDLLTKPKLSQLTYHIQEYTIPGNDSTPLFPLYDKNRNVIWIGDTAIDSRRILEFNLMTHKFVEHKLNGTSIVTVMAFDHNNNNQIWYVDPLLKRLGHYDLSANITKLYNIPTRGTISRIAVDLNNNVWLTSPDSNELLRFDSQAKNFTMLHLPTTNAMPIGILLDKATGMLWIAEGIGKLASVDPIKNYKINEYPMTANNNKSYYSPAELFTNTVTGGNLYVSDHDNHTVSVFNPILKTFKTYPVFNPSALPFGMAMDNYGYLWVAEHTTNKIAVIDTETGLSREIAIPKVNPYVQFLTSDSKGNIWFVEQRGNALGVIIHTPTKPS
jgi:copper transport protein